MTSASSITDPGLPSAEQMTDIIDIEGIMTLPMDQIIFYTLLILGIIAIVLLIFYIVRWYKKRPIKSGKKLPPYELALNALRALENSDYLKKGDFRRYYFELSDILRCYLEGQYGYPALDKTTAEITSDLSHKLKLSSLLQESIAHLLKRADLAKFANHVPDHVMAVADKDFMIQFVEFSKNDEGRNHTTKEGHLLLPRQE